ncbi:MAG TPA: TIGR03435 family protein [Steroidobacteraceae bacterium]
MPRTHGCRVWFAASVKFLIPFQLLTWLGSRFPWRSALAPTTQPTLFEQIVQPVGTRLKTVLINRFQLVAHPETQQLAALALRVAAGGSKLNAVPADVLDHPRPMFKMEPRVWMANSTTVATLTGPIARITGQPVVDEAGLKGLYDFALNGPLSAGTLPTALRDQLGFTLDPTTTNVDLVVIDSIQLPTIDTAPQPTA